MTKGESNSGLNSKTGKNFNETFLVFKGVKPQIVHEIIQESGFQSQLEKFDNFYEIKSSSNGTSFFITFSNFDQEHNSYLKMSAIAYYKDSNDISADLNHINKFNSTYPHIKAFINEAGGLTIQMDWSTKNDITVVQIVQWLQLWRAGMVIFEDFCSNTVD